MENIVSLCSHCHNLLHYGKFEDKNLFLKNYLMKEKSVKCCWLRYYIRKIRSFCFSMIQASFVIKLISALIGSASLVRPK